ncbi:hypothetical protein E2562_039087 [Oryza meyeriana var. granulata]|uniref:Uncharacterized protein n=1 Tax=Oryza meyeriana var. granulata TaxID=110450 RepID=A0A6G1C1C1_9ORYZ|nr:hypothetical protein E2562_039087 [Oryza meyeriana var. granulata]
MKTARGLDSTPVEVVNELQAALTEVVSELHATPMEVIWSSVLHPSMSRALYPWRSSVSSRLWL